MLDAIIDSLTDGGIKAHAVLAVLFDLGDKTAIFAERLAFFENLSTFLVRDVDDMTDEFEIGITFAERTGEFEDDIFECVDCDVLWPDDPSGRMA